MKTTWQILAGMDVPIADFNLEECSQALTEEEASKLNLLVSNENKTIDFDKYIALTPLVAACILDDVRLFDMIKQRVTYAKTLSNLEGNVEHKAVSSSPQFDDEKCVLVSTLLRASRDTKPFVNMTPIYIAIMFGHIDVVKQIVAIDKILVRISAECDYFNYRSILTETVDVLHDDTPLSFMLDMSHDKSSIIEVMKLLATPNNINIISGILIQETPLIRAIKNRYGLDVINTLLDINGVNVNYKPQQYIGPTALEAAVKTGREDIVRRLLSVPGINIGMHINAANKEHAGHIAIAENKPAILNSLLAHGGFALNGEDGSTPLIIHAVMMNKLDMVRILLGQPNVNVNAMKEYDDKTALIIAVDRRHIEIVKLLLQHKETDANILVSEDMSYIDLISVLCLGKQTPNLENLSVLHLAVKNGDLDMLEVFLRRENVDVDWNQKTEKVGSHDSAGNTPLHLAAKCKNDRESAMRMYRFLSKIKAVNPSVKNDNGKTPMSELWAREDHPLHTSTLSVEKEKVSNNNEKINKHYVNLPPMLV